MRQVEISPVAQAVALKINDPMHEVWVNDIYECQVRYLEPRGRAGALHLSLKRRDRAVGRDWRHLQSIKNEVAGWEREALELFPAESRLVDQANQTHIWVLPRDMEVPFGFRQRVVLTEADSRAATDRLGIDTSKARQRPWQDGLSTGPEFGLRVGLR